MEQLREPTSGVAIAPLCVALHVPRASLYRTLERERNPVASKPRPKPARALSDEDRQEVLAVLHAPQFVDKPPAQVYAILLDQGRYLCSVRTMYRLLHQEDEVHERRNQRSHTAYAKPELLATAPNQVWSWDITKLKGPGKWNVYHLYVILDIYSRYTVGWMLHSCEDANVAKQFIAMTCDKQQIQPGQLTLHADRGAAMRSKAVENLLAALGVTKTHNRPQVSNDNPFSESQFKTLKYQPEYPKRFEDIEAARAYCVQFFDRYNKEHRHSALGFLTPEDVHYGRATQRLATRQQALDRAYAQTPERFVRKPPKPAPLPDAVWINPPDNTGQLQTPAATDECAECATLKMPDETEVGPAGEQPTEG